MKLVLVRHGETVSNQSRIYAGWSNEPLTPNGVAQAHARGRALAQTPSISVIYTSPLERARQTAMVLAEHLGCSVRVDPALIEMKMGPWEQKSEQEVEAEFPDLWKLWLERPADVVLPGRETLQELLHRYLKFVEEVRARHHLGDIAVVTHYAIIRVAVLHAQGLDLNRYKTIHVPNCEAFSVEV